ncbi:aminoglycoside phosphotransferase family protein [Bacillus marinisedimentorum]|uniref:aminoglycoside phosphotransferase family protein n=1 Tax=Bacillus marinisedimentorum TaxID=1821260 RepID=UPI0007DE6B27|nr:aminoglycoside phosphotransferase family protein [Bacillus marinisedimentorum]
MADTKRLYEHISIDSDKVQRIFSDYDGQLHVKKIKPITTGMSTSNYEVLTNKGPSLLKIYPGSNNHSSKEISAYKYARTVIQVPDIHYSRSGTGLNENYAIFQFINGKTLDCYIKEQNEFPAAAAYEIGRMLGLLHNREYPLIALLDDRLEVKQAVMPFHQQYEFYLNGFTGKHLGEKFTAQLLDFVDSNRNMVKAIDEKNVFVHGDFNPSNILIDKKGSAWFIDFEYCYAGPPYSDIGKLLRARKQIKYDNEEVYKKFEAGYNSKAKEPLPAEWLTLSKIADIATMLALINRETIPAGWAEEIKNDCRAIMQQMEK